MSWAWPSTPPWRWVMKLSCWMLTSTSHRRRRNVAWPFALTQKNWKNIFYCATAARCFYDRFARKTKACTRPLITPWRGRIGTSVTLVSCRNFPMNKWHASPKLITRAKWHLLLWRRRRRAIRRFLAWYTPNKTRTTPKRNLRLPCAAISSIQAWVIAWCKKWLIIVAGRGRSI